MTYSVVMPALTRYLVFTVMLNLFQHLFTENTTPEQDPDVRQDDAQCRYAGLTLCRHTGLDPVSCFRHQDDTFVCLGAWRSNFLFPADEGAFGFPHHGAAQRTRLVHVEYPDRQVMIPGQSKSSQIHHLEFAIQYIIII
jgi:hypothetical protein